ncbi:HpcH/HpaI aldolase/citrate lyase family protein [Jannaschia sp. R86511]|uniref:HpcH/HpaI aldolase family protein n=1 Tax=Jannaschia sp. R86511 TaxID=3093853 RepID=UPI0036D3B25A
MTTRPEPDPVATSDGSGGPASSGGEGVVARSSGRLRRRWAAGQPAVGVWSMLADPFVAELLGACDADYVVLDLQHGAATWADLPMLCQAMRAAGRAPLVRVPWNEPVHVMRALDCGAAGVVVPLVDSAEDARSAVRACAFPPAGERSWGPMWGDVRADGALPPAQQDADVLCVVMVETRAGVDAVAEIAAVPGVDAVYVGPNDLALGCGHGRATYRDSAAVDALLQQVLDACRSAGTVAGLHCSDTEMAAHWAGRGYGMVTTATDTTVLRHGLDAAFAEVAGRFDR